MEEKMQEDGRITVVVVKNGVAKEVNVPKDIARMLEEAYENAKVVGISQSTYKAMAEMLAGKILLYKQILQEADDKEMFAKAIAFCRAFDIYSNESPMLIDIMLWVDRSVEEFGEKFTSRQVNSRNIMSYLRGKAINGKATYGELNKDFKLWARSLFSSCDLKVGFVKFAKFYYSVVANA